jgi:hypothetical protein
MTYCRNALVRRARCALLLAVCGTALFLGCGPTIGDHPPVYPVKGKVLFRGKPISAGVVIYELEGGDSAPSNQSQPRGPLRATGRIEADGSFELIAFQGALGVPEGNYKVGISSIAARSEANLLESAKSAKKGDSNVLQGRYADPKTSGLRDQVFKDHTNEPTFDLK